MNSPAKPLRKACYYSATIACSCYYCEWWCGAINCVIVVSPRKPARCYVSPPKVAKISHRLKINIVSCPKDIAEGVVAGKYRLLFFTPETILNSRKWIYFIQE